MKSMKIERPLSLRLVRETLRSLNVQTNVKTGAKPGPTDATCACGMKGCIEQSVLLNPF